MSLYVYVWGNNAKRARLQGRQCRIVNRRRAALNSVLVEFTDNGQREVVSRNALRKEK